MRAEVKFVHLVAIFAKVYFRAESVSYLQITSLAGYIHSSFKGFYGISDCLRHSECQMPVGKQCTFRKA